MEQTKTKKPKRRITELLDPEFMARLDTLDVLSRKILQGKMQGERRSKRRGQSVEFADHRPYVAGDDLRFVDWNIYGRLEQLFLKLFLEEQDLTVNIALDVSGSMAEQDALYHPAPKPNGKEIPKGKKTSKEHFLKKLTAALGYVSLVNNNRVTVSSFSQGLTGQLANMRGRNYLGRMADFLLSSTSEGPSDFESACRQIATARIGSGIMIVLSDFFFKEGYEAGLRCLLGNRYDLYVIQVLSPEEMKPTISGDLKLVDIEDADTAEITVSSALMDYYKRTLTAYCNELKEYCNRRGAIYILANSADPVESLVLNYLRRIRLVR